jgi:hypothetical protein
MRLIRPTLPLHRFRLAAVALELFLSIGALGGGGALMLGPRGEILPLPLAALRGSPFDTYFVPGLILFGALGLGSLVAARLAWLGHPMAPVAASVVGVVLLIWIAVEIAVIGYSNEPPLQPFYLLLGAAITTVGLTWTGAVASSRHPSLSASAHPHPRAIKTSGGHS